MSSDAQTQRLTLGPATIDFLTLEAASASIARGEFRGGVHLCNAYTLALAEEQPDVAHALAADTSNLPDGTPLVWWAKRHGRPFAERVYGPDLMQAVLDLSQRLGTKHYLYGSTPQVLASLEQAIAARWPNSLVVGSESPPFRELTADEVGESVRRAMDLDADVVWVGMGTPKQDLLVHQMAAVGDQTYVAIGAAFDFIAGTKSQAPRWMMRLGLEWLFRLITEPRRLWKRYLVYNAKFLRLLWRDRSASRRGEAGPT